MNDNDAAVVIGYLDTHPAFDPGWPAYRATSPGNVWTGNKLLDGYGGAWDRDRGREPGADYQGSIQQEYDWILLQSGRQPVSGFGIYHYTIFGNIGTFVPPGGAAQLPAGPATPAVPAVPIGNVIVGPLNQLTTWAKAHPIQAAAVGFGVLILMRRR